VEELSCATKERKRKAAPHRERKPVEEKPANNREYALRPWDLKRAQYDIQHKNHSGFRWKLAEEASDSKGIERDVDIQNKLLSVLYVKRRQNISDPGIGNQELERLLGCPAEHLAFHFWYLREKGWIGRTESGMLAITVEGVDRANSEHHRATTNKLLTDQSHTG
jgi:hypothetical protein